VAEDKWQLMTLTQVANNAKEPALMTSLALLKPKAFNLGSFLDTLRKGQAQSQHDAGQHRPVKSSSLTTPAKPSLLTTPDKSWLPITPVKSWLPMTPVKSSLLMTPVKSSLLITPIKSWSLQAVEPGATDRGSLPHSALTLGAGPDSPTTADGLTFCTWITDAKPSSRTLSTPHTIDRSSLCSIGSSRGGGENPRLAAGGAEMVSVPSLCVFSLNTRLYFAGSWRYYDRQFVTLVLTTKGSPCHQVCEQRYVKVDPYNNPFFFRRRCCEPEPSVNVFAATSVQVEVLFTDSPNVCHMVNTNSEQIFFSKVKVTDK
jgi:hypothetical protein